MSDVIYSINERGYFIHNNMLFYIIMDSKGLPCQIEIVEEMEFEEHKSVFEQLHNYYDITEYNEAMSNIECYEERGELRT